MILHLPGPAGARRWCNQQRAGQRRIGFVPTMGALHEGHLSLVRRSLEENDVACVSIFVNPLQFNDPGDFSNYPKEMGKDLQLLNEIGCDMVFSGTLGQFFPDTVAPGQIEMVDPGPHARGLEGAHRPGHFHGVRAICERLFRTVGPCRAYFGEKDFQQTLVVKDLAGDLGYPEIVVGPTSREPSGLARSSRNALLSDANRATFAAVIYQALTDARHAWREGERSPARLREIMRAKLDTPGIEIEYADLRDPLAWSADSPGQPMERARALIAVDIGGVRLIDNLRLDGEEEKGRELNGARVNAGGC